jgi:hypothetical protein
MKRLRLAAALALVALALYSAWYLYLSPRLAGDAFVNALKSFDRPAMEAALCGGTALDQVIRGDGLVGDQLTRLALGLLESALPPEMRQGLAGALTSDARYDVLSSTYIFRLRLADGATLPGLDPAQPPATGDIVLNIRRAPVRACVAGSR